MPSPRHGPAHAEARTISGTITVFDVPTNDYRKLILHEGALRPRLPLSRVKLLRDHDSRDPVGYMASLSADTKTAVFKVATGESGDRALFEAHPDNKLRDGLSVGIQVLSEPGAYLYDEETGEYHVYAAELLEVSLCAIPAYSGAEVDQVRASYTIPPTTLTTPAPTPKEENTMDPETLAAQLDEHTASQERLMESRLSAFTTASAAPFVGLFGTVWGIMRAFHDIYQMGNANLATVAKPISEALIATAVGLFVALEAVILFNFLQNLAGSISRRLAYAADEALELIRVRADAPVPAAALLPGTVTPTHIPAGGENAGSAAK